MSWFVPKRATEATADQLIATGAFGAYGYDPVDGDVGYRRLGDQGRDMPWWTLDKARGYSVNAYRANPLARAILDTYTSFVVGDSGLTLQCGNPEVKVAAEEFWNDPRNAVVKTDLFLRDHLLMGETAAEMLTGPVTGVTRFSIVDPIRIAGVGLKDGNPLWPDRLVVRMPNSDDREMAIAAIDDLSGLRSGEVMFWASFKALLTDRRGVPFLSPIMDDLDNFDTVLNNLIDRTAVMRYIAMQVKLKNAGPKEIDDFIKARGGTHVPKAGTVEVTNDSVEWSPLQATVGAQEDTTTGSAILTNIAGGAGLAKTWLAEPDGANRATSLSMAEPVRRRVGGVQNLWLAYVTDMVRYSVDQQVAARRIPAMVESSDSAGGQLMVPASSTVHVTGPAIAAADASVTAMVLESLSKALLGLVAGKVMSAEAAQIAVKKAWEQFVGVPWTSNLDVTGAGVDDLADELDKANPAAVTLKLA